MRHMDITSQHPWHALLQTPLSPEQLAQPLAEDDPEWDAIDSQMVRLGSLAHASLNIAQLQQQLLALLTEKSKDFRLIVHLLRTLQHAGQPDELMLAVSLLTDYVQHFWQIAWPQDPRYKTRFAGQILKRFDSAAGSFSASASAEQGESMQGLLAHLAQVWHPLDAALAQQVDGLRARYTPQTNFAVVTPQATAEPSRPAVPPAQQPTVASTPALNIDRSSDKAWRQTLLQLADMLCELQPETAMGYRLRRYAVWGALSAPPMAQADGRTPLAAVSADRTADYLARVATADLALWREVEQSLTLAPYWLDGHVLSAQIAQRLGHEPVAQAIRDELNDFLARLPALASLCFSDMTPFLSPDSSRWLGQHETSGNGNSAIEQDEIWQCYHQQGLQAALQMLDAQPEPPDPRAHFYRQLLSNQLLEAAGLTTLAQQHYHHLGLLAQQMTLSTWEPSLIALLTEKQRQFKS